MRRNYHRGMSAMLFAVLSILLASGCTTVTTEVRTGPEENWRYTIKEPKRESSPNGPMGELRYRGREVLPYFTTVAVGNRTFDYVVRIDRSDFRGYRMTEGAEAGQPAAESSAAETRAAGATRTPTTITQKELDRTWYFAPQEGRKKGTPESWVWVKRLNVEAFVAPDRLSRLADKLDLYPVDGNTEDAPESGVSLGIRFTTIF